MALEDILPSFSFANDPRANLSLRERIAMQMMAGAQKKGYPKNLGEGLTAIGDALGQIGLSRQLQAADVQAQLAAKAAGGSLAGAPQTVRQAPTNPDVPADGEKTSEADTEPAASPALAYNDTTDNTDTTPSPIGASVYGPSATDIASASPGASIVPPIAPAAPRNAIATAMLAPPTAPGVPQANPTLPGDGSPSPQASVLSDASPAAPGMPKVAQAETATATDQPIVVPGVQRAPPPAVPPPQRPLTPEELARQPAPTAETFDATIPALRAPRPPAMTPQSSAEAQAQEIMLSNQGNPYLVQRMQQVIKEEQAKRLFIDKQNMDQYANDLQTFNQLQMDRAKGITGRAQAMATGKESVERGLQTQLENDLRIRFAGLPPSEVFGQLNGTKTQAVAAARALVAAKSAMANFDKGIITGTRAETRLDIAKLFTTMGLVDKHDLIANTETFRSNLQPIVAAILRGTSGTSQLSEGELLFAKLNSPNILQDPQTIRQVIKFVADNAGQVVDTHNQSIDTMFGTEPRYENARKLFKVEAPPASSVGMPAPGGAAPHFNSADEAKAAFGARPPGTVIDIMINGRKAKLRY